MSLVALDGSFCLPLGPSLTAFTHTGPGVTSVTLDAADESAMTIGQVVWADGGSHTIDTTGSSSIGWRTAGVTFANAGTTVKIGVGAVDATAGPPARAANAAGVITFDVNAAPVGGGGGITANAWHTSVPTAGTKTIATGDMVAVSVQMTARGGADSVTVTQVSCSAVPNRPGITSYLSAVYAVAGGASPNIILTASDGTLGWIYGSTPASTIANLSWNNTSTPKEYGQLFKLPFPCKIYGIYTLFAFDGDCDFVLYSDPLGTPVAERTSSGDLNVTTSATVRVAIIQFATPYNATAEQTIAVAMKPTTATNVTSVYRRLASATHRVVDPGGTDSYGVSRDTGVFSNANSSLDHYYIGLLVGGFGPDAITAGLHPIDRGIA